MKESVRERFVTNREVLNLKNNTGIVKKPLNPFTEWVPLHFLCSSVYPIINHSIWDFCPPENQREFNSLFFKHCNDAKMNAHKRAIFCLLHSCKHIIIPLLVKLSTLERAQFLKFLSRFSNELMSPQEIEDCLLKRNNKFGDFAPGLFFWHFFETSLSEEYSHGLFGIQCHILTILSGYLIVLKEKFGCDDSNSFRFEFLTLLECLTKWVGFGRKTDNIFDLEHEINLLVVNTMQSYLFSTKSFRGLVETLYESEITRRKVEFDASNLEYLIFPITTILTLHHQFFMLEIESPIALFRLTQLFNENQYEYHPEMHPIVELEFDLFRKSNTSNPEIESELDLLKDSSFWKSKLSSLVKNTIIIIPQIKLESIESVRDCVQLEDDLKVIFKDVDFDFFSSLKTNLELVQTRGSIFE